MAYIMGTDAPETLTGTNANDAILGFAGDDHILGLDGSDQLFGHGGADLLEGGLGDDIYQLIDDRSDTIIDIGGWDTIRATVGIDLEDYPEIENLTMAIDYSGRHLLGNGLDNELIDWGGSNRLDGRDGDDYLNAGAGNDLLIGGLGTEFMLGGQGRDRFDFRSVEEIGTGETTRDVIWDFKPTADKINLGAIDANEQFSGNQAFQLLGFAEFTGKAGELRWVYEQRADLSAVTLVEGDTDGDGVADFQIELNGRLPMYAADFIL